MSSVKLLDTLSPPWDHNIILMTAFATIVHFELNKLFYLLKQLVGYDENNGYAQPFQKLLLGILSHLYAVDVVSIRTSASGIDFEVLANCVVGHQSGIVTQVQSAKTHQDEADST